MSRTKKIILALIIIFIAIQLIQPARNKSSQVLPTDFTKVYTVPGNVQSVLKNACYDCHSNNTSYPWYSYVQPIAWMMARHIRNGKEQLNFNDFGGYPVRRQISKLKSIANQIKDDEMPLSSYKMMHFNARLSQADKMLVTNWIQKTADSIARNN